MAEEDKTKGVDTAAAASVPQPKSPVSTKSDGTPSSPKTPKKDSELMEDVTPEKVADYLNEANTKMKDFQKQIEDLKKSTRSREAKKEWLQRK